MSDSGTINASNPGDADGPGIRSSALHVLGYILQLELTDARWERVDGLLTIAVEATAVGDLGTLRTATNELEMVGPLRVRRIGDAPVGPPPVKVRERVEVMRSLLETRDGTGKPEEEGSHDGQ